MEAIQAIECALDCVLPEPLRDLYRAQDTPKRRDAWVPLRLMSVAEVIEFHPVARDLGWTELGLHIFWTDDNSNYAGLYIAGPLEGKVCFLDHEENDLSPVYASLRSFLTVMQTSIVQDLDWFKFPRDYPATEPSDDREAEERDWQIVQTLRPLYEASQDEERTYYACCMIALTPCSYTESLLDFTYDDDLIIPARACEVLGLRRYEPAIDRLGEVAQRGLPNGCMAAIEALGRINTEAARSQLRELLTSLPDGYGFYVRRALKAAW